MNINIKLIIFIISYFLKLLSERQECLSFQKSLEFGRGNLQLSGELALWFSNIKRSCKNISIIHMFKNNTY